MRTTWSRARVKAGDVKELQALGDNVRDAIGSGAGVLGAAFEDGKATLLDRRERCAAREGRVRRTTS